MLSNDIEIWGGIEGTINRVNNDYLDQSEYSGHYRREGDIDLIASLGIKMLRYPVLWEKHQPQKDTVIDWSFTEKSLTRLKELHVEPIAGLVHHGSGPVFVNFFDGSFEAGIAEYAKLVATKFPWLQYYTPVNEPLTTARFCGLYGHWYPHKRDEYSFYKILLSECRATVMAMKAIREINPNASLIQTEDLGKTYSTPLLKYQADFENRRRWLSYDLLCGRVNRQHFFWKYLVKHVGIPEQELSYFLKNKCVPDICGFNYYITSERYLDENLAKYPTETHGGNGRHRYADVETVRVDIEKKTGPSVLLREAFEYLKRPLAVTECHLHCTREEQMRWFNDMWETVKVLKQDGIDIRALTAWALFGLHGWNKLVTEPWGTYEPGVFNLSTGCPRPTALARLIQVLTAHKVYYHPVLATEGWWKRDSRVHFPMRKVIAMKGKKQVPQCQPVLIIGRPDSIGQALTTSCSQRHIHNILVSKADIDVGDPQSIEQLIRELNPWAIIHTPDNAGVDAAEQDPGRFFDLHSKGPAILAEVCRKFPGVKLVCFSSDLVFDGSKNAPYLESDVVNPLNVYGKGSAAVESDILRAKPDALVIRTGTLFSPFDGQNFVANTLVNLKQGRKISLANDVYISPTYVPDLVHHTLDLLLDNEAGIVHVANDTQTTWAEFGIRIAEMAGCDKTLIRPRPVSQLGLKAQTPRYSVLQSEIGVQLPNLDDALFRYFEVTSDYQSEAIAV